MSPSELCLRIQWSVVRCLIFGRCRRQMLSLSHDRKYGFTQDNVRKRGTVSVRLCPASDPRHVIQSTEVPYRCSTGTIKWSPRSQCVACVAFHEIRFLTTLPGVHIHHAEHSCAIACIAWRPGRYDAEYETLAAFDVNYGMRLWKVCPDQGRAYIIGAYDFRPMLKSVVGMYWAPHSGHLVTHKAAGCTNVDVWDIGDPDPTESRCIQAKRRHVVRIELHEQLRLVQWRKSDSALVCTCSNTVQCWQLVPEVRQLSEMEI